jgi:hypothetical protein
MLGAHKKAQRAEVKEVTGIVEPSRVKKQKLLSNSVYDIEGY